MYSSAHGRKMIIVQSIVSTHCSYGRRVCRYESASCTTSTSPGWNWTTFYLESGTCPPLGPKSQHVSTSVESHHDRAKSSRDDHRRRKSYPSHVRFVDHSVLASSPYVCSRVILCVTRYVLLCISVSVVRYRHIQNSVSFMHFTDILIFEQGLLVLPPSAPIRYQNEVPSDTCRT